MSDTDNSHRAPGRGSTIPRGADLVVVGAGVAGLVAAWEATRAGAEVLVLEDSAARPPASEVAAGMIAPVGEATWGEKRTLGAALASAELWPQFAAELGEAAGVEVPFRRCGALHIALDRDEAAELERRRQLLDGLALGAESILPGEARELEPGLSPRLAAALHAPGEGEVDPRALLAALRQAASAGGASFQRARVTGVPAAVHPGRGRLVLATQDGTSTSSVEAGRVVLATGAWSGEHDLGAAGPELRVRPVAGEIVRLAADPAAMPCEAIVKTERVYIVPRASGELVVGATAEERGFDTGVRAGAVHELLREAYRALPELAEADFIEAGAGLRPGTPDNAPLIGAVRDDGPIVLAGLYRNGVLLTPLIGRAAAALIAGRPLPPQLAGLGPGRFAEAGTACGVPA